MNTEQWLQQIHPQWNPQQATSFPSEFYTSSDLYQLEKQRVFGKSWYCVGLTHQLSAPGSYFTVDIAEFPLLILRTQQGILRGFFNICSHRASPLVLGCGQTHLLSCPYHAWCFDLEGNLKGIPDMQDAEAFDWQAHALTPVRVDTWGPFIFVNHDLEAESLQSYLGELPQQFQRYRLEELALAHRAEYWVDANWKLFVETNAENYHEAVLHPAFAPYYKDIQLKAEGNYIYQWAPEKDLAYIDKTEREEAQAEVTIAGLTPGEMASNRIVTLFPNFDLSCTANLASASIVDPQGVDKTRIELFWLVPNTAAALSPENMQPMIVTRDQIHKEDLQILPDLQKRHASGHYRPGRICPTREAGLLLFQNLVIQYLKANPAT